jgi:hypothetical protein
MAPERRGGVVQLWPGVNKARGEPVSPLSIANCASRSRWALCRRRHHKAHYADLRIMPSDTWNLAAEAVIAAMGSA